MGAGKGVLDGAEECISTWRTLGVHFARRISTLRTLGTPWSTPGRALVFLLACLVRSTAKLKARGLLGVSGVGS